jgi:hypothetical protein
MVGEIVLASESGCAVLAAILRCGGPLCVGGVCLCGDRRVGGRKIHKRSGFACVGLEPHRAEEEALGGGCHSFWSESMTCLAPGAG